MTAMSSGWMFAPVWRTNRAKSFCRSVLFFLAMWLKLRIRIEYTADGETLFRGISQDVTLHELSNTRMWQIHFAYVNVYMCTALPTKQPRKTFLRHRICSSSVKTTSSTLIRRSSAIILLLSITIHSLLNAMKWHNKAKLVLICSVPAWINQRTTTRNPD